MAAGLFHFGLQLLHSLFGLGEVAGLYIPIEFDPDRMRDRLVEPLDDRSGEPVAGLADQFDGQVGAGGLEVGLIGDDGAFQAELQHPRLFAIRQVKPALGIVQVVRIERTMLVEGRFNALAPLAEFRRGIERNIQPADRTEREAIEGNVNPLAHAGIVASGAERGTPRIERSEVET
jgi:hypothetical protein